MLEHRRHRGQRFTPRVRTGRLFSYAVVLALLFLLAVGASACSSGNQSGMAGGGSQHAMGNVVHSYTLADLPQNKNAVFPSFVEAGIMHDSYAYALEHPDQIQYMPCYCGCGLTANHKSNLDCYIAGVDQDGKVVFDNHASFCSICLEITQDVKRLSAEGKSLKEIRVYIDQTHGEKGPGTDTPLPPS
jgi:hypothetical protein